METHPVLGIIFFIICVFLIWKLFTPTEKSTENYDASVRIYPDLTMNYGSDRKWYCLQQHQDYMGYRNCMLYRE